MTRNNLLLIGTTSMTTVNMVRNNRRVVVWRDHNSKLLIQTLVLCAGGKVVESFLTASSETPGVLKSKKKWNFRNISNDYR